MIGNGKKGGGGREPDPPPEESCHEGGGKGEGRGIGGLLGHQDECISGEIFCIFFFFSLDKSFVNED